MLLDGPEERSLGVVGWGPTEPPLPGVRHTCATASHRTGVATRPSTGSVRRILVPRSRFRHRVLAFSSAAVVQPFPA